MHVVQPTDLREKSRVSLVVVAAEIYRARPVVSPLNHRARLQAIRAHLVDVAAVAWLHDRPVAEREQVLKMSGSQQSSALLSEFHVILKLLESTD